MFSFCFDVKRKGTVEYEFRMFALYSGMYSIIQKSTFTVTCLLTVTCSSQHVSALLPSLVLNTSHVNNTYSFQSILSQHNQMFLFDIKTYQFKAYET